jgi:hypothetical protein
MKDNKQIQHLAEQTWPLFERKWKRMLFWKKWLKKLVFSAASALVVSINLLLIQTKSPSIEKSGTKFAPHQNQDQTDSSANSRKADFSLLQPNKYQVGLPNELNSLHPDKNYWFVMQTQSPRLLRTTPKFGLAKRADLQLAFALLNFDPKSWSVQTNGYSLSALLDARTLMIMNLMDGTEKLPAYPTYFTEETVYRPDFFPIDQYIHIAFYDVTDWIQDPLSAQPLINRPNQQIPLAPWRTSSNPKSTTMANLFTLSAFDRENPGLFVYRGIDQKYNRSAQMQYRKVLYLADRPAESFNPILFHRNDTLVVVSAQAQKVIQLSKNGFQYMTKEIIYKSKGIQSAKRHEPLLDPVDNTLYVLVPTNFHFVIYKVDCNSGIAHQVYQTASVWKGAEFEIIAKELIYNYKGEIITVQLP